MATDRFFAGNAPTAARLFLGASLVAAAGAAAAGEFSLRTDLLVAGEHFEAAESSFNSGPLGLRSRSGAYASLRPDLRWKSDRWLLLLSPRGVVSWTDVRGAPDGEEPDLYDDDASIHEAIVRFSPLRGLYLSAGRENLQWGPSYLVSASNPFIRDNGRNNPSREVPGLDYARVAWLFGEGWGLSAIANLDGGELDRSGEFPRRYALKLDYTGQSKYVSLIPSWREPLDDTDVDDDYQLGSYAGWTVSDALLLYAEGNYRFREDQAAGLVGVAYTFVNGANLAFELYHDSGGCARKPYLRCVFGDAPPDMDPPPELPPEPPPAGSSAATTPALPETLAADLGRRNYLLLQWLDHSRFADWDFTVRWIYGIDDDSSQVVGVIDYDAGPNLRLFLIGSGFFGSRGSELHSVLDAYASIGLRLSF